MKKEQGGVKNTFMMTLHLITDKTLFKGEMQ